MRRRGDCDYVQEREDAVIGGMWSLPELVGGCSNCHQRLMRVADIQIDVLKLRLCDDCARAMHELLESMLSD